MAFELPKLPYAFDAHEPHIDAKTMEIHHDKYHAAYVTNANAALEKHPEFGKKTVEELLWGINDVPEDIRTVIRNNAGGHANHSIFWTIMGPGGGGNPNGRIADALKNTFGGYDQFKEQLQKAAVGQFGSGWAWLVADREAVLAILLMAGVLIQTPKASGLGGTIGGGDSGLGGGYRTRRGLERQIYWTTWVLVVAFLICSIANVWVTTHLSG